MSGTESPLVCPNAIPRSLHVGNVANVAYGYAKTLTRRGAQVKVICHDVTHLMSQPEWDDLALDPEDFPDEADFNVNTADLGEYRRPPWFVSDTIEGSTERASIVRRAARHLPPELKIVLKPLYYRALHVCDRAFRTNIFARKGRPVPKDDDGRVRELAQVAARFGSGWEIDPFLLTHYRRHGTWVSSHSMDTEVVFSYALATIYSLFVVDKPRIAVEIGTLRDVPFGSSPLSRLLWLGYRLSDHVVITNPDTVELVRQAGIQSFSFCPHPVDETVFHPADETALRRQLQEKYGTQTMLFAPARQNWRLKGSDKMLHGFASAIARGINATLLIPGWGQEIARSEALCRKLGIESRVAWLPPMPERLLARYYRAVDLVLDQFQLGVFGLITPKAMACGAAVLTSYDDRHNAWCFPTAPPVVPCFSRDEIASAILRLSSDHEARRTIGAASREWVKRHHSSERVTHCLEKAMASAGGVFAKRRFAA